MKYLGRFLLLMIGVALSTLGLVYWQHRGFSFEGIWLYDNGYRPHPLHLLVLGIAMIPPAMWEIFLLDAHRGVDSNRDDANRGVEVRPDATDD